jgi:rare lipoprotein A
MRRRAGDPLAAPTQRGTGRIGRCCACSEGDRKRGPSRARQLTSQAPLVRCQESIVPTLHRRARIIALASLTVAAAPSAATAQTPAPAPSAAPTSTPAPHAVKRQIKLAHRKLEVGVGRSTAVTGRVLGLTPDRAAVRLQMRKPGRWVTIDRARTKRNGRFRLDDRRHVVGSMPLRVVAPGKSTAKRVVKRVGRLNVYRTAHASWYGPGLYGNRLGCGGTLNAGTLGVANKSLPCGTKVTLRHGSKSVRVKVIDRGPYVGGREYDLTAATAQRIGFSGHGALKVTR